MLRSVIVLIFLLLNVSCTKNLFDEIADKDTSDALYFQAKQEINSRNYAAAIALLESMDPAYLAARERLPVHASAYSGRCGLEFLTLLDNLQNSGATTVFSTLMSALPGAVLPDNMTDCNQSQTILSSVGDQDDRTGDENLLMAFTSLTEIGAILSARADNDDDGIADAGFDQCSSAQLPDAEVREIGVNIAITIVSLAAIGTSYIDDALADVNALCNLDANLSRFCTNTDPSLFSNDEVRALRWALGSNDVGINSCGNRSFSQCALANPPPGCL